MSKDPGHKDSSKIWGLFSLVAAVAAAAAARKALNLSWKAATGKPPPANPASPDVEMREALAWAKKICGKSPTAQRMLKYAFNAVDDGLVGQQLFAGEATRLAYMTDEAREGRDSFLEKRPPDWSRYPWYY